jgi:hypothetical protein
MRAIIISCIIIIGIVLLIHPFYIKNSVESYQNNNVIVETEYKYQGGPEWSSSDVTQWKDDIEDLYKIFNNTQSKLQKVYASYSHWTTMTPKQRSQAKMIEDPISVYYDPLTKGSKLPLGGLSDNEGRLPYGIPKISLPPPSGLSSVNGGIEYDWEPRSSDEKKFYKQSSLYANTMKTAVEKLASSVELINWSTNGDKTISLLPRILEIQKEADEQKKNFAEKQKVHRSKTAGTEGFETIEKRVVIIDVYPFVDAVNFVNSTKRALSTMNNELDKTNEDILQASQILNKMQEEGQATHDKLKNAAKN